MKKKNFMIKAARVALGLILPVSIANAYSGGLIGGGDVEYTVIQTCDLTSHFPTHDDFKTLELIKEENNKHYKFRVSGGSAPHKFFQTSIPFEVIADAAGNEVPLVEVDGYYPLVDLNEEDIGSVQLPHVDESGIEVRKGRIAPLSHRDGVPEAFITNCRFN